MILYNRVFNRGAIKAVFYGYVWYGQRVLGCFTASKRNDVSLNTNGAGLQAKQEVTESRHPAAHIDFDIVCVLCSE